MFDDLSKRDWRDDVEAIREESRMSGGIREIQTLLAIIDKQQETLKMGIAMREKQKAYFKDRTQEKLIASKQAESSFDKASAELFGAK